MRRYTERTRDAPRVLPRPQGGVEGGGASSARPRELESNNMVFKTSTWGRKRKNLSFQLETWRMRQRETETETETERREALCFQKKKKNRRRFYFIFLAKCFPLQPQPPPPAPPAPCAEAAQLRPEFLSVPALGDCAVSVRRRRVCVCGVYPFSIRIC